MLSSCLFTQLRQDLRENDWGKALALVDGVWLMSSYKIWKLTRFVMDFPSAIVVYSFYEALRYLWVSEIVGIVFFQEILQRLLYTHDHWWVSSILQLHNGSKMSMELKPHHIECFAITWSLVPLLHDDTKHVYTVILQQLGDDARNIIAIWNDWECWKPKRLLKSDSHSKRPPNPQLAEVLGIIQLILVGIKHCKCMVIFMDLPFSPVHKGCWLEPFFRRSSVLSQIDSLPAPWRFDFWLGTESIPFAPCMELDTYIVALNVW